MIHSPQKFIDGFWNWDILDGCFGDTNIKPSDVDGATERKGKFLFIETKKPGVQLPKGQEIFYRSLVRLQKNFVFVIIVWGDKDTPQYAQTMSSRGVSETFNCDLPKFRSLVNGWFEYANK